MQAFGHFLPNKMKFYINIFLCLSLLKALSRKGSGFSDKNDLEACLQGVFNDKARRREAPKPLKVFIYVYFLIFNSAKFFGTILVNCLMNPVNLRRYNNEKTYDFGAWRHDCG